jgi:hypothetical protein
MFHRPKPRQFDYKPIYTKPDTDTENSSEQTHSLRKKFAEKRDEIGGKKSQTQKNSIIIYVVVALLLLYFIFFK